MSSSMILISCEPRERARKTAVFAAAGSAGNRSRSGSRGSSDHQPPFVVKIGAAGKSSGVWWRVRECSARCAAARAPSAIRRADVTPQRIIAFVSAPDSTWTWASTKPGTIHFPVPSITRTSFASASCPRRAATVETSAKRPFRTRIHDPATGAAPVPSMSVAPVISTAFGFGCGSFAARTGVTTERRTAARAGRRRPRTRLAFDFGMSRETRTGGTSSSSRAKRSDPRTRGLLRRCATRNDGRSAHRGLEATARARPRDPTRPRAPPAPTRPPGSRPGTSR